MIEYAPLQLTEAFLGITMNYNSLRGNKGYDRSTGGFVHNIFARTHNDVKELNMESTPGGITPVANYYGMKVQTVTLDGYFPYRYPDEFWDVFMVGLSAYREKCTTKNIFLVGSILTVTKNSTFNDLPIGSTWYVKRYSYVREIQHPDSAGFNIVLWRWWESE